MNDPNVHRTLSPDGTGLAYTVRGEGRPVVFVHGWMASSTVFDDLFAVWPGDGLHSIRLDLRGSGASEPASTDYSIARLAEDVVATIEACSAPQAVLVGHSMGGQIAQYVAAHHPDRVDRLILICPVPAAGLPLPTQIRDLFRSAGGRADVLGQILDMACRQLPSSSHARLVESALRIDPKVVAEMLDTWTAGGFEADLPRIIAATEVIATDDPFLSAGLLEREVTAKISGARQRLIHGPGHYPTSEASQQLARALDELLADGGSP